MIYSYLADFARTIRFLIVGSEKADSGDIELLNRPPQQLQELVFLAGYCLRAPCSHLTCPFSELLPVLPTDGIFEIDAVISRVHGTNANDAPIAQWYWKDETGSWQAYNSFDSRMLEVRLTPLSRYEEMGQLQMAHIAGEREVVVQVLGQVYRIDLERQMQVNELTGNERAVQRRAIPQHPQKGAIAIAIMHAAFAVRRQHAGGNEVDKRAELLNANRVLLEQVVRLLFPILVEIDGSSVSLTTILKHACESLVEWSGDSL